MRSLLAIVFSGLMFTAQAGQPLKLDTTLSAPYQVMVNGELSGLSVSILRCVFAEMQQPYEFSLLPWVRAVEDLKQGHTDGIFTAMPASTLRHTAEMSDPFALEKWYWFSLPGRSLPEDPAQWVVGGIRSSNQVSWLAENRIPVNAVVNDLEQLIRLLMGKRIDGFLADERVVAEALKVMGVAGDALDKRFSRYMPLGIYFSREFLQHRPGFLHDFNGHMDVCAPQSMALNGIEQREVETLLRDRIMPQLNTLDLSGVLAKANHRHRNYSEADVHRLDAEWVRAVKDDQQSRLVLQVTGHPLADIFRQLEDESDALYGEIFLADRYGMNVAASQPTSDYYQADESLYQRAVSSDGKPVMGPIRYDASSRRFQVQVAWSLPAEEGHAGVIVVGLNVEEALRKVQPEQRRGAQ
ncbi:substrate-binding periplasmic protein [Thalassolituus marinus]|uniref:Transporter substrate-binding domain-containing protein n=1 Tax=Thalassolituus marinus TaxID=671053 RepID=A0ABS7ZU83_9GAMM|nr:transporter substrate-binding domain-containing protein [Thalassolituus marinus]MCA6065226.1 transporter substrate-binding domain-containing protein [Thalassolituus marinus]